MVDHSLILKQTEKVLSFQETEKRADILIDVRAAKEHNEGTYPDCVNIPIFDNEERKLVGTIYRHGGQQQAIDKGFELVEAKLADFIDLFKPYRGKKLGIFCARGGMRSRSVVNLLNDSGFSAWQIEGGYKGFRRIVLEEFAKFRPNLIVLHGLTGTGKTRILQKLDNMIDLEDMAQHRSSLFGGINQTPRTQKNFDAHLYRLIRKLGQQPYFIEGESRKLGEIYLPAGLAEAMQSGKLVLLKTSLEKRIDRIVEDYPVPDSETAEKIITILKKLTRRLGQARVKEMIGFLENGDLRELVRVLLLDYYDKRYDNAMSGYAYDLELDADNIDDAATALSEYRLSLLS